MGEEKTKARSMRSRRTMSLTHSSNALLWK